MFSLFIFTICIDAHFSALVIGSLFNKLALGTFFFFFKSCIEICSTYHKISPFQVFCSVIFNKFTELYNHHHDPNLEHFCYLNIFYLASPLSMRDLRPLYRDWTQTPAVKALGPNHWTTREFPRKLLSPQKGPLCLSANQSTLPCLVPKQPLILLSL